MGVFDQIRTGLDEPIAYEKGVYNTLTERIRQECDESMRRTVPEAHAAFCERARRNGAKERHIDACEDAFILTFEDAYREGWSAGYMQLRHDLKARAKETAIELRGLTLDELLIEATGLTLQEVLAMYKEK